MGKDSGHRSVRLGREVLNVAGSAEVWGWGPAPGTRMVF